MRSIIRRTWIHLVCGLIVNFVGFSSCIRDSDYPWTYQCVQNTMDGPACQRQEVPSNSTDKVPLKICILTCGRYGGLWPYPSEVSLGKDLSAFTLGQVHFAPAAITSEDNALARMVLDAEATFTNYIKQLIPDGYTSPYRRGFRKNSNVVINIQILKTDTKLRLDTDESYRLTITPSADKDVIVSIIAPTYFGFRHSLETLAQLIDFDKEQADFKVVNTVRIVDKPAFRYRGLLLDTARNFIPIPHIKRMIDGLSYNKMNIFHWHMTDSNSFPFDSRRVPQMVKYGTYSSQKIYKSHEVKELVEYANKRGVKIVPEFDMPAHAGNGWQWGEASGLGTLSFCVNAEPSTNYCIQPPCGQLNPLNNNVYNILGQLFRDFLEVFDNDVFHMGGDEISFKCWLSSQEIQEWLATQNATGLDLLDLWGLFQDKAFLKLKEAGRGKAIDAIVWTSELTSQARKYLDPEDYIIQIWTKSIDDITKGLYEEGYRIIFSNNDTVYLDHGYGPWRGNFVNKNVPIKTWQVLYANDILGQVERQVGRAKMQQLYKQGKLMGGIATLWSEKADEFNMDMKLWPRGAAYAERLWSNPPSRLNVTQMAYPRLIHQRERLITRGIRPDTLLPEACYNIWGFCDYTYW